MAGVGLSPTSTDEEAIPNERWRAGGRRLFGGGGDADGSDSAGGAVDEPRAADIIDERVQPVERLAAAGRHDDGLFDAVQIVGKQSNTLRALQEVGQPLTIGTEGVHRAIGEQPDYL